MGIPDGARFICVTVRDSAFLDSFRPDEDWSYHNYRDSNVENYILAATEIAERGYYVIRMGAKVKKPMKTDHPRIIDYATNGMRTDFMDIWLGAHCEFCISVSTGFDAVPIIFRRPIVYVNMVPAGYFPTFRNQVLCIFKHHFSLESGGELTLAEIFSHDVGFCLKTSGYASKGVALVENTPEEIRDIVLEMDERLKGTWQSTPEDDLLQLGLWGIRRALALHGEIRAKFGATFLRNNREWLQ